jgi:hypothetical protein
VTKKDKKLALWQHGMHGAEMLFESVEARNPEEAILIVQTQLQAIRLEQSKRTPAAFRTEELVTNNMDGTFDVTVKMVAIDRPPSATDIGDELKDCIKLRGGLKGAKIEDRGGGPDGKNRAGRPGFPPDRPKAPKPPKQNATPGKPST